MSDEIATAYSAALDALHRTGPKPLHALAAMLGGDPALATGDGLAAHLAAAGPDDALRQQLHHLLATWDNARTEVAWACNTTRNTAERRDAITTALDVGKATTDLFADLFPYFATDSPIIIAENWTQWRTPQQQTERDFYWAHYRDCLIAKGWNPHAVADLGEAAEEIVRRLADPTQAEAYQVKGIVVGHVQSGKTANFTGVIAKAVDAGYRLIIVLTGTTNMLRAQTQRRIDMELCGRENLETEISTEDTHGHDYQSDPDWLNDRFIRHGGRPSDSDRPDIIRLSNHAGDYRRLRQGFAALEFAKTLRHRKLYEPANLYTCNARLVVAKKNGPVLRGLVADLGRIKDRLGEVPALIIDDESDQASVNTISPKKWQSESKKRTAINRLIGDLLRLMPRAQYVGYTATPYANVFIDPADIDDIFPRNFLISLKRPLDYMGPDDFHDLDSDVPVEERPLAASKERAHLRTLSDEPDEGELREALDMFLLTGAVKCHRQRLGAATYRHHTMLVHEAMNREVHRDTAARIAALWHTAGYQTPAGLVRLRHLYQKDVLPVSTALADPSLPTPTDFGDLVEDIGRALELICPTDAAANPVIVVNSDKDLERNQETLDFDQRDIWRILVGGNKLARGFTVEGLTVTYYRRSTTQVDTLMQMGRWFGFRPKYRDLVRLYTTRDLYQMFEAAVRDEEYLRSELRRYSVWKDDGPEITPRQIPPLIAQHRADLRPTGRNKMWNARLVEKRSPGQFVEPVAYPTIAAKVRENTERWRPILAADKVGIFKVPGADTHYQAFYTSVRHDEMVSLLEGLHWNNPATMQPDLEWLRRLESWQLESWIVMLPQNAQESNRRKLFGDAARSIFVRARPGDSFAVISENRHRNAARRIVQLPTDFPDGLADDLAAPRTAAMVVYPVVASVHHGPAVPGDVDGSIPLDAVTIGFTMVTPLSTASSDDRLIKWRTCSSDESAIVVDVDAT